MNKPEFDFTAALEQLQTGQPLIGKDGILTPLIKQLVEAALEAEIEHYLKQEENRSNRRNGYGKKTIKAASGSFEFLSKMTTKAPILSLRHKRLKKSTPFVPYAYIFIKKLQ